MILTLLLGLHTLIWQWLIPLTGHHVLKLALAVDLMRQVAVFSVNQANSWWLVGVWLLEHMIGDSGGS